MDSTALAKLQETGDFVTTGQAFDLFKCNLRLFLHGAPKPVSITAEQGDSAGMCQSRTQGVFDFDYDIRQARSDDSTPLHKLKKAAERLAGSRLSWWPLSDPRLDLRTGHVRVYSKPCVSSPTPDSYDRLTLRHRDVPGSMMIFL